MTKTKRRSKPDSREVELDPDIKDELLQIRAMDIRSYWPACRQVAEELDVTAADVSASAHQDTFEYHAMWGPEGRPRRDE